MNATVEDLLRIIGELEVQRRLLLAELAALSAPQPDIEPAPEPSTRPRKG